MKRLVWLLALAGCPEPSAYLVTDVHAGGRPVAGALVGVYCPGNPRRDVLDVTAGLAHKTDDLGRARVVVPGSIRAGDCTVTAAKPGFPTIEARGANVCMSTADCPALEIDLAAGSDVARPPIELEPAPSREFARPSRLASPPAEVAR